MTLAEYLQSRNLNSYAFASLIGVKPQSVYRYIKDGRVPKSDVLALILEVTGGLVTPNDFFEEAKQPRKKRRAAA